MATMSDSAFTPLFPNGKNQAIFAPNGGKGMDLAHQQKIMQQLQLQKQQQMMANFHLQAMTNPPVHVSASMNGTSTPGTTSPQSAQIGNFSPVSECNTESTGPVSSATSPINFSSSISGTSSLNTSLSSAEISAMNGHESGDSLIVPNNKLVGNTEVSAVSPVPMVNLGVTVTAPSTIDGQVDTGVGLTSNAENDLNMALNSANGITSFEQLQQMGLTSNANALDMLQANAAGSAHLGLNGVPENTTSSPSASIPNMSSIWSNPAGLPLDDQGLLSEQAIYQVLQAQQQQQQLAAWANQQNAALNGLAGGQGIPNLSSAGIFNTGGLPTTNAAQQQAQLQALQQQLAMRRNQNMLNQAMHTGLHRSTSLQQGSMGMPKGPGYSSWSSGQANLANNMYNNAAVRNNSTLFNSLSHSNSPSGRVTTYNGVPNSRKPPMGNHVIAPPKFNRSFSTPTKYNGFSGSQVPPLTSIDDNPFFKLTGEEPSPANNLLSNLQERSPVDTMHMGSLESQLYDILRSENGVGGTPPFARNGKWNDIGQDPLFEDSHLPLSGYDQIAPNLNRISPLLGEYGRERYSRKVFVGGLPPDIDEEEIQASFRHFGPLIVDWPHKAESKSYFPPKGYAFLLFQSEISVQNLINCCIKDEDKLYLCVSSPTIKEKPVQIRPWNLADSDFVLDGSQPLDPRKTIFVGGVPRPLRAVELAMIMDRLYGGVCYAGIDVDPELKYPKGAGRVAFSNQQSYIAAISARFVQLQHGDIDKRVEVKPYVLDDQLCDECQGARCGGKFAPFFCANVTCLQYYCEQCWANIHSRPGREFHKPLVKEGADRSPRSIFRW
uniref:cytoplasmic polyadenylation element-binding protein 2-like n=1 Tax=Styela clava TaxID=7725 RepID=UPI001939647C|nr:cytoplasmic polyadenylation element-binding protein 2-like [Styela clava]